MANDITKNECLDALSTLWHHSCTHFEHVLDNLDRKYPDWKTMRLPHVSDTPDNETAASMQEFKAWARVRDILRRAGRVALDDVKGRE